MSLERPDRHRRKRLFIRQAQVQIDGTDQCLSSGISGGLLRRQFQEQAPRGRRGLKVESLATNFIEHGIDQHEKKVSQHQLRG